MVIYISQLMNSLERGERGHILEVRREEIYEVGKVFSEYPFVVIDSYGENYILKVEGEKNA